MLPQLIVLGLYVLSLGLTLGLHGQPRPPYSFWTALLSVALMLPLLWWGGFFAPMGL